MQHDSCQPCHSQTCSQSTQAFEAVFRHLKCKTMQRKVIYSFHKHYRPTSSRDAQKNNSDKW